MDYLKIVPDSLKNKKCFSCGNDLIQFWNSDWMCLKENPGSYHYRLVISKSNFLIREEARITANNKIYKIEQHYPNYLDVGRFDIFIHVFYVPDRFGTKNISFSYNGTVPMFDFLNGGGEEKILNKVKMMLTFR